MKRLMLLLVILFTAVPANGEEITLVKHAHKKQETATKNYAVQRGDMLSQILIDECGAKVDQLPYLYKQFRKLNPNIKNLNKIYAGQKVVLPTLTPAKPDPSQTQNLAVKAVEQDVYVIKQGEHLSKILREVYGLNDEQIYYEYLSAIQDLNPDLKDVDHIIPGQKIVIPVKQESSPQETSPKKTDTNTPMVNEVIENSISPAIAKNVTPQDPGPSIAAPAAKNKTSAAAKSTIQESPAPQPVKNEQPVKGKKETINRLIRSILFPAVKEMGGSPKDQGTYFMPLDGGGSVTIDTQEIPVLELDTGNRIVLDLQNKISPKMRVLIEKAFPNCKIISQAGPDLESLMDKVLSVSGYFSLNKNASPLLVGSDEKLKLYGKWIVYKDFTRSNVLIINILDDNEQKTPESIQHYAKRFGLELIELGGKDEATTRSSQTKITNLNHSITALFYRLGITYELNKQIDLGGGDTGIQIAYKAPVITGNTIFAAEPPSELVQELLKDRGLQLESLKDVQCRNALLALGYNVDGPPIKITISKGRTELEIPGFQIANAVVLEAAVDEDITSYLASTGKDVLLW